MTEILEVPVNCVGVICFRKDTVLIIQRGKSPRKGEWSIPGGRIEPGETENEAVSRELLEETGVTAIIGQKVALIDAVFEGKLYRLHDYVAQWDHGEPVAGDDAAQAKFVRVSEISRFGLWDKTCEVIRDAYALCKN